MPRKPKATPAELPAISAELLEQFGSGPMTAEAINAATLALKRALIERALGGGMNHHLGYSSSAAKPPEVSNQRNGKSAKTVLTDDGPIRIEVPRDATAVSSRCSSRSTNAASTHAASAALLKVLQLAAA